MRVNRLGFLPAAFIVFTGTAAPVRAQDVSPAPQISEPIRTDLPLVLLFLPRTDVKTRTKNDPNTALRVVLRDSLRDSGRYRAVGFNPSEPVVKRALREHLIASADVVEPISPEAMQRLGKAFGARYLLSVDTAMERDTMSTAIRLLESADGETWHTLFADNTTTPLVVERRRLKFDDAIAALADHITVKMGLPPHLAQEPLVPITKKMTKPRETKKTAPKPTGDDAAVTKAVPPTPADTVPTETPKPPKTVTKNVKNNKKANKPVVKAELPKTDPSLMRDVPTKTVPNPTKAAAPQELDPKTVAPKITATPKNTAPTNDNGGFTAFTTDGIAGRDTPPALPEIAPPPGLAKPDIEAAVSRYRQAGDLANVIASLRRAINEKPRDVSLRRQLIQAYQDRQMLDAALAETDRAQQLMPDDAGLRRMRGDALLAKGDMAGATTAYREAMRLDPGDVSAQVALADALLADSQFGEALAGYEAAAKADPKSPLPHRRLARAFAMQASGDPKQYAASLEQTRLARALTPPTDSDIYLEDYTLLMRLLESRLHDMLNELQSDYQAYRQGKMNANELRRALVDVKTRAEAAGDYLDKLPPAVGEDTPHAHYQQAAALLMQAVSLFRDYLGKPDSATEAAFRGAQVDANRELNDGAKSLRTPKAAPEAARPAADS